MPKLSEHKLLQALMLGTAFIGIGLDRISYHDYDHHKKVIESVHKEDPAKAYGIALNSLLEKKDSIELFPYNNTRAYKEYLDSHKEDKEKGEEWSKAHPNFRYSSLFQCD